MQSQISHCAGYKLSNYFGCKQLLAWLAILSVVALTSGVALAKSLDFDYLMKRKWYKGESQNFVVYSDLMAIKVERLMEHLETFSTFSQIMLDLPSEQRESKSIMFVTGKDKTWLSLGQKPTLLTRMLFPKDETVTLVRAGSSYNATLSGVSQVRVSMFSTIAAHQISKSDHGKSLPLWYRDGMPRYLATFQRKGDNVYVGKLDSVLGRLISLVNATQQVESFDMESLLTRRSFPKRSDFSGLSKYINQVNELYSLHLLLVHYFNSSEIRQNQMTHYLEMLSQGVSEQEALETATGLNFEEMGKLLYRYISGSKLYARTYRNNEMDSLIKDRQGEYRMKPGIERVNSWEVVSKFAKIPVDQRTSHVSNELNAKFDRAVEAARLSYEANN